MYAMHTNTHSPFALFNPRRRNCLNFKKWENGTLIACFLSNHVEGGAS